jgi:hypothetical protein
MCDKLACHGTLSQWLTGLDTAWQQHTLDAAVPLFFPLAGIPASMAATPEGAAALASSQTVAASLPVMSGTQMGMPAQSQLAAMSAAAQPLQAAQLVNGYAGLPSSVQAAAAAAAASQLGSPPPSYGLGDTSASAAAAAQQQAAAAQAQAQVHAAAQNLAELQQQVNLSTSLAQAQLQQAQAAQQQQQAQAAIWS